MSKTLLYVIAILLLWLVIVRKNSFTININESVEENKIDISKTENDNIAKG